MLFSETMKDSVEKDVSREPGPDPSAPVTRKGLLLSLSTGKSMEIPEQDMVSITGCEWCVFITDNKLYNS